MTAHALAHERLLLVAAGNAVKPFPIRQLADDLACLCELQIDRRCAVRRNFGGPGANEVITRCTRRDRIFAGSEPAGWERVAALVVGDDRGGDGRAVLLGAD